MWEGRRANSEALDAAPACSTAPGTPKLVLKVDDSAKTGRRRVTRTDTARPDPNFITVLAASESLYRQSE